MNTVTPLRYVVLRHEGVESPHFDLLFETAPGSDLSAWRSSEWPITEGAAFTPLRNHRRFYLTYEGDVSGGRGSVYRLHEGAHMIECDDEKQLRVTLETGQRLRLERGRK